MNKIIIFIIICHMTCINTYHIFLLTWRVLQGRYEFCYGMYNRPREWNLSTTRIPGFHTDIFGVTGNDHCIYTYVHICVYT